MGRSVVQDVYKPADVRLPKRLGGGVLKEYVVRDHATKNVLHYALAYINPLIYSGDNGRVLGYDKSHGLPHKHWMGQRSEEPFISYEALYEKFQNEWMDIAIRFVNGEL
ncbi:hypothetical protein B9Z39_13840 [Limnohabitans sp. JirII-29]|nr:hypothetical protein B9Z39_13840 [Limnohabitans sp. JirII-29]